MKEVKKNQNGITLVALVVTIVVLLILAGVTIALVMNNNGIINRATEARDQSVDKNVRELVSVALMATQADYFTGRGEFASITSTSTDEEVNTAAKNSLKAELQGIGLGCTADPTVTIDKDTKVFTGSATVTLNGYQYSVTINTNGGTLEDKIGVSGGTKVTTPGA